MNIFSLLTRNFERKLFGFVAGLTVLLFFTLPRFGVAQSLPDGWSAVHQDFNGKWFSINLKTLTFLESPTPIVSFALHEQGVQGYYRWELHCADQRVIHQGTAVSIIGEANTVRRNIFDGLCGYKHEGKEWVLVGASLKSDGKLETFIFFDRSSIKAADNPFIGRSVQILRAGSDGRRFAPLARAEWVYDCTNPSRLAGRQPGEETFSFMEGALANSLAHSTNMLVCSENFFKAGLLIPAPQEVPSGKKTDSSTTFDTAQKTCTDLGFKKGTEKFGDCVLRLSR